MSNSVAQEPRRRAQKALQRSPIYALRSLRVEQDGEQLVLEGRVSTFYFKQLAQELVRSVAADTRVVNHVNVD